MTEVFEAESLSDSETDALNEEGREAFNLRSGLNWENSDKEQIFERSASYSVFIKDFIENEAKRAKQQRDFRQIFFWLVMGVLIAFLAGSAWVVFALLRCQCRYKNA